MKAVITYDSAGTAETAVVEGPHIKMQMTPPQPRSKHALLWVKVYASPECRRRDQTECHFFAAAYSARLVDIAE